MPAMPRMSNKATKIAYKILGIPANVQSKKTKKQKKLEEALTAEETVRVR
jgi:hypothetical protein